LRRDPDGNHNCLNITFRVGPPSTVCLDCLIVCEE
jgi:hypothetical protein